MILLLLEELDLCQNLNPREKLTTVLKEKQVFQNINRVNSGRFINEVKRERTRNICC